MTNRYKSFLTAGLMTLNMSSFAQKQAKPNVIFIFPDQFRNFSLGYWNQGDNSGYIQGKPDPAITPSLTKLASEGIVFSRVMSTFPLSSPYRGMLMTGKYPSKNGLTANCHKDRPVGINADGKAMADIFGDAGYETAYFGKCHWERTEPLFDEKGTYQGTTKQPGGFYINAFDTYVPAGKSRLGFTYFFQTLRDKHYDPLCYSSDPKAIEGRKDGELYEPKRFSPELESKALLDYLDNTHGQRNPDKPFFVVWSLNPPHSPWTEESTDMSFFPQYTENGKVDIQKMLLRENADKKAGSYAPYYFANVSAVDFYIGKVLNKLKEMGIEDNTIIIFTSDHGEMLGSHGETGKPYPEIESCNVPMVMKWGNRLGHRVDDLMLSTPDIMPTLLGLAGLDNQIPAAVQGTNYSELIRNPAKNNKKAPESVLYFDNFSRGLYTGKYTFIVKEDGKGKLKDVFYYDNKKDPYQLHRIRGQEMDSALVSGFKKVLVSRLKSIDDQWAHNKICDDYLAW